MKSYFISIKVFTNLELNNTAGSFNSKYSKKPKVEELDDKIFRIEEENMEGYQSIFIQLTWKGFSIIH